MSFTQLGSPSQLIELLTSNIFIDTNLALGGLLQLNGSTPITGGYFDLLVRNTQPAWGLAINVSSGTVSLNSNGQGGYTLQLDATGTQCASPCAGVNASTKSFGFIQGPFTISLSSTINFPSNTPNNPGRFTATALSADVTGSSVPEPMTTLLVGAGLAGFILLRRRAAQ